MIGNINILQILFICLSHLSVTNVSGFSQPQRRIIRTRPHSELPASSSLSPTAVSIPQKCVDITSQSLLQASQSTSDDISDESGIRQSYNISKWSFALVSLILFIMPDKTLTQRLATKWGGASGFGISAFVFHLLSIQEDTSEQNREEYAGFVKRCQLGLAGFCALGLFSIPGEAAFWSTPGPAMMTSALMTLTRLGGLMVSFRGWTENVTELRLHKELWNGWLDNLRGWKVQDKKKSLFYRNSLFIVGMSLISNILEGIFQLRYQAALELSSFLASLYVSTVSRLFLVSSLLFSLKLAAESDQFPKRVFWKLNWALALWAGVVGLGQCVSYPFRFSFKRVEMLTFSLLLFLKGFKVYKQEYPAEAETNEPDIETNKEGDDHQEE